MTRTAVGVSPRTGGALCYLPGGVGLAFAFFAVAVEREDRFLRFHAFQSLLLHAVCIVLLAGCEGGALLLATLGQHLAAWALALLPVLPGLAFPVLLVGAWRGREPGLPWLGGIARRSA
jgi:uncharacterized membrane protein